MDSEEILYGTGLLASLALIGLNISNNTFELWSFIGGASLMFCGYGVYNYIHNDYASMCE
jgi:hypothetical protein